MFLNELPAIEFVKICEDVLIEHFRHEALYHIPIQLTSCCVRLFEGIQEDDKFVAMLNLFQHNVGKEHALEWIYFDFGDCFKSSQR